MNRGQDTLKKFKKIYLEITNTCGAACSFCPGTVRAPAFMAWDDFRDVIKKIKGRADYLAFHLMGEPLLHPDLPLFIDIAGENGFKVNLASNGRHILAAEPLLEKEALRQVSFSLHSAADMESAQVEEYLGRIFEFTDRALKGDRVHVSFRLWSIDRGDNTGRMLKMIKERYNKELDTTPAETHVKGVKVRGKLFLHMAKEFEWPDLKNRDYGKRGFCLGLREQAGILADFTVVPCCLDRDGVMALGNIKEKTWEEILSGQRAKNIYDGFSRREAVEELCRRCGYRQRFESAKKN